MTAPMTATIFADRMAVDYSTVMRWLRKGLVPGAELKESPERGKWWEIPETALEMERPRWGGPPKAEREQTAEASAAQKVTNKASKKAKKGSDQ